MRTELAIGTDEPGRRIDHPVVEVRDLRLQPGAVPFDEVVSARGSKSGHEQRKRIDTVFEDVAWPIPIVDRCRDVAAALGPDIEGVRQRHVDTIAIAKTDE